MRHISIQAAHSIALGCSAWFRSQGAFEATPLLERRSVLYVIIHNSWLYQGLSVNNLEACTECDTLVDVLGELLVRRVTKCFVQLERYHG